MWKSERGRTSLSIRLSGWKTPADKDEVRVKYVLKAVDGGDGDAGLTSPAGGEEEAVFALADAPARGLAEAIWFVTQRIDGPGVSMVDGFVRQSGGQMRIVSRQGRGSTVTLLVPA